MEIVYAVDGTPIGNRVEFLEEGTGFVDAAERGSIGTGGVLIQDPDSTLSLQAWQTFTVDDMDATPTRVWTGYLGPRTHSRAAGSGLSRVFDCDLWDLNTLLALDILHSNAAKRPAESDLVRVGWLLGSEVLNGVVSDEGLVAATNAQNYLEADCRGSYAADVIGEMAPSAVKNFAVYRDDTSGNAGLIYDQDTSSAYASTSRISNVRSDEDADTFYPFIDAAHVRTPENQYGAVWYDWGSGTPLYVTSPTTIATMGLPVPKAAKYSTSRIGRLATAQQASKDWLNVRAQEENTITVTLRVPSDKVNTIRAWHRLQVKFTHLPGFTSFTWTRVYRRQVVPESEGMWLMRLQLVVIGVPVSDAELPVAGDCDDDLLEAASWTYTHYDETDNGLNDGGPGPDLVAGWETTIDDGNDSTGAAMATGHVTGPNGVLKYDIRSDLGSSQTATHVRAGGYACGGWTFRVYVGATLGALTTLVSETVLPGSDPIDITFASTTSRYWTFQMSHYHAGFTYITGFGTGGQGLSVGELCDASVEVPLPGTGDQIDNGATTPGVDGTETTFFATDANGTVVPYIDGTLVVLIDGIDVWADVTESDPETGEFTLGFAPKSDERTRTRFVAR